VLTVPKLLKVRHAFAVLAAILPLCASSTLGTPSTQSPPDLRVFSSLSTLLTVPQQDSRRTRVSPATISISSSGRLIAFISFARLARADTNDGPDVYVLDRITGDVTLESAMPASAPGCVSHPRLSGDGRFIVFEIVRSSRDGSRPMANVAIRDRTVGSTRLVESVTGGPPNGWTGAPAISEDGQVIVFASNATDLVGGPDANGTGADIYLLRQATRSIQRVDTGGQAGRAQAGGSSPAVSGDGHVVAFTSAAGTSMLRLERRDTRFDAVRTIPESANGASFAASLSRDGEYMAFTSLASNLVAGDRNRTSDIFLYEATSGRIHLVSRSVAGGAANGASGSPALSPDGRYVAFQSDASDLVCMRRCHAAAEDINLLPDVFVFDRLSHTIEWISVGADRGWIEESTGPAVDNEARVVGFSSRHPIGADDVANDFDLFVRVTQGPRR
jgi:Tol biopolymer transport system component